MRHAIIAVCATAAAMLFAMAPFDATEARQRHETAQTMTPAEAEDWDVVQSTFTDFSRRGFAAIGQRVPQLEAALARAPASYPIQESRGNTILLRADDHVAELTLAAVLGAAAQSTDGARRNGAGSVSVVASPNVYGTIAMMLGSYFNEIGEHGRALVPLERGLAIQPDNPLLVVERGGALIKLKRPADAVAGYDAALAVEDIYMELQRGKLLRNRGIALIDLERLDEAEANLRESLALEPDNEVAKSELEYIAELRTGAARNEVQLTTPNHVEPMPERKK